MHHIVDLVPGNLQRHIVDAIASLPWLFGNGENYQGTAVVLFPQIAPSARTQQAGATPSAAPLPTTRIHLAQGSMLAGHPLGGLRGVVGEDDIGACPPQA